MQLTQSDRITRNDRFNHLRSSLKAMPVFSKTTSKVQEKLSRMEESVTANTIKSQDDLTQSMIFSEDPSEKQPEAVTPYSLFEQKYEVGEKIGEGAHGVIKKCTSRKTGKVYAVKTISLDLEHILSLKSNFLSMRRLKHPNVLEHRGIYFEMTKQRCHIVTEYHPHPDLLSCPITSEHELKKIIYQLVDTLRYLHSQKVCHRDIKPENILYDKVKQSITLVDFGVSAKLTKRGRKVEMYTVTGTPSYRAPEMFECGYNELIDMWALGVTVFQLMTGHTPFESEYHCDTITNILRGEYQFPPETAQKFSPAAIKFVQRLLKPKEQRLTANQAIHDLWFMDIEHELDDFSHSLDVNSPGDFLNMSIVYGTGSCLSPKDRKRRCSQQQNSSAEVRELKQSWQDEKEMAVFGSLKRVQSRQYQLNDV